MSPADVARIEKIVAEAERATELADWHEACAAQLRRTAAGQAEIADDDRQRGPDRNRATKREREYLRRAINHADTAVLLRAPSPSIDRGRG